MLRRAEPDAVTVWMALSAAARVRLRVFGHESRRQRLTGEADTIRLGPRLHVVAVTAADGEGLEWGRFYEYDLQLLDLGQDLSSAGLLGEPVDDSAQTAEGLSTLRYPGFDRPSFALPPRDLNRLRILHGSCRKPQGEGRDALSAVDHILAGAARDPARRPQLLFLTGDQIYADDVADPLLHMLLDAGSSLFGPPDEEALPGFETPNLWRSHPEFLKPGGRSGLAEHQAGFTGMIPDRPDKAKSHLLSFREYTAMHLFAWSEALWPAKLPSYAEVHPDRAKERDDAYLLKPYEQDYQRFRTDSERLERLRQTLPNVRRALANIAVYTICDDHEVTDDWYFNLEWCRRVLSKPLGRAAVRNGLLAYAFFQAWGNTPRQFERGASGRRLIELTADWCANGGEPDPEIESLLSIPELADLEAMNEPRLVHPEGALEWHYCLRGPDDFYSILVLDIRTWRGFPGKPSGASELIHEEGVRKQLERLPKVDPEGVTIVVSGNPVIGIPVLQDVQNAQSDFRSRLALDVEFWKAQNAGFEMLLASLATASEPGRSGRTARRVVFLSGDVHFGYAAWLRYWADRPYAFDQPRPTLAVFAQLNASSFKNQTTGGLATTYTLHRQGYNPYFLGDGIATTHHWMGWNVDSPEGLTVGRPRSWFLRRHPYRVMRSPAVLEPDQIERLEIRVRPDWQYRTGYVTSTAAEYRGAELEEYLGRAGAQKLSEGQQIVGLNHVAEVTFDWKDEKCVAQDVWWYWEDSDFPYPLSHFVVDLSLQESPPEP